MFYVKVKNKGIWEIERNGVFTPLRRSFHRGVKVFYATDPLKEHRVKLVNIFILAMNYAILHQVYLIIFEIHGIDINAIKK